MYLYTKHCDLALMIHPNKHIKLGRKYFKLKVGHHMVYSCLYYLGFWASNDPWGNPMDYIGSTGETLLTVAMFGMRCPLEMWKRKSDS